MWMLGNVGISLYFSITKLWVSQTMDGCTKANNWPNATTWSTVSWLYCKILWAPPAVSKWQRAKKACEWKLRTEMEMVIFRLRSYYQFGSCLTLEKIKKKIQVKQCLKDADKSLHSIVQQAMSAVCLGRAGDESLLRMLTVSSINESKTS